MSVGIIIIMQKEQKSNNKQTKNKRQLRDSQNAQLIRQEVDQLNNKVSRYPTMWNSFNTWFAFSFAFFAFIFSTRAHDFIYFLWRVQPHPNILHFLLT